LPGPEAGLDLAVEDGEDWRQIFPIFANLQLSSSPREKNYFFTNSTPWGALSLELILLFISHLNAVKASHQEA
jgi:hypothetical protein